jgi:hypothetical protein
MGWSLPDSPVVAGLTVLLVRDPSRPWKALIVATGVLAALSANATIANDYDPSRGSRRRLG